MWMCCKHHGEKYSFTVYPHKGNRKIKTELFTHKNLTASWHFILAFRSSHYLAEWFLRWNDKSPKKDVWKLVGHFQLSQWLGRATGLIISGRRWFISCNSPKIRTVHTSNHHAPPASPPPLQLWVPVSPTFLCHLLQITTILPLCLSSTVTFLIISYLSSSRIHIPISFQKTLLSTSVLSSKVNLHGELLSSFEVFW